LTVRVGCRLVYEATQPTPILLVVRPWNQERQILLDEKLIIEREPPYKECKDWFGNSVQSWDLPPGQTTIVHDALFEVPRYADDHNRHRGPSRIGGLPVDLLRYTLPSRYCDSDKTQRFANQHFGFLINGLDRVIAICNWVHHNIRYVTGSGSPDISASEIIARGYGVCRDFAHVAITLCRGVNIPARYVTGHMPDIGFDDPGTPMDFHAYFEAYLGRQWCVFDARYNVPRIGRVKIAHGLDAVDGAFSTVYGDAKLTSFRVWAYQVDPTVVSVGDPLDMSRRLDGTRKIRFV
jgi:transglutaminase-like putative cysteine protease